MPAHTRGDRATRSRLTLLALLLGASVVSGCEPRQDDGPSGGGSPRGLLRDADLLARAAVVIGSCFPDDGINRNLAHLWEAGPRLWNRFAYAAECLASHGRGCRALEACVGWSVEPSSDRECASCKGSVAERCSDGARIRIDCAKLGLLCDERALCSEAPATSCDSDSFSARCTSDGRPEFCDDGVVFRGERCAALGLTCADGACTGQGASCTDRSWPLDGTTDWTGTSCDGSALEACVRGQLARRDCAAAGPGFACESFDGVPFCGLGSECQPGELPGADQEGTPVRCEDTTVVFCNAGRIERVDCKDLGFTSCDARSGLCTGVSPRD